MLSFDRDGDLLFGAKISFRRLDRGVSQQKLNLLEIASGLPAELRASPAEIMGPEPLNADLLCGLLDNRPDRPVAQTSLHLAALGDRTEQGALFDLGGDGSPWGISDEVANDVGREPSTRPEESIALVAPVLGYQSESAFSATFKRHWGSSPRAYVLASRLGTQEL